MKRLLVSCFAAVLLLAVPGRLAHADDASRRAKVAELFEVMHLDQMMSQMMPMVMNQARAMMEQQMGTSLTDDQKQKLAELQDRVSAVVQEQMSWPKLEPEMIDVYAETYTEPEIDGILAFYRSPAGQAMLAKTPQLATRSMAITQSRMQVVMPQIQKIIADFVKENTPAATGGKAHPSSTATQPKS